MIPGSDFKTLFALFEERKESFLQILYKVRLFVKNGSLKAENPLDEQDWEVDSQPEEPRVATEDQRIKLKIKKAGVKFHMDTNSEMDHESRVESFYEVGMVDPFRTKKSLEQTIKEYKKFDFNTETHHKAALKIVYDSLKEGKPIQPPKTVFVPTKKILRQMIRAVAQFGKDNHFRFLLRFALLEDPHVKFQMRPKID